MIGKNVNETSAALTLLISTTILISPFWCVVTFIVLAITRNNKEQDTIRFFLFFSLSYFLALVLSTANLGGDLLGYKKLFLSSTDVNVMNFLKSQRKEIVYSGYSFILSKLTNGAFNFYVGFTVFIMYFILFKSIANYAKNILLDFNKTYILIVFIAFFPPIFHLNGILLRQNLAVLILFYGFSSMKKVSWKYILLSLIASLIHYIAFPLFLLSLLDTRLFKRKNVIGSLFVMFIFYNYGNLFLDLLSSYSESFRYLLVRMERDDIYNGDSGSVEEMLIPVLLFALQLIISVTAFLKKKSFFSFLYIKYSVVFLLIYVFIDNNVLEYRVLLINYFFIPFVSIELLMAYSVKIRNTIFAGLLVILPVYIAVFFFYISIRNEPNAYRDTLVLLTNPLF